MIHIRTFLIIIILCIGSVSYCQKNVSPGMSIVTLADPTIFYNAKTYYLYGTGSGGTANPGSGFVVYTSPDLINWYGPAGAGNGLVLKRGDAFGTKGFWAPQVLISQVKL